MNTLLRSSLSFMVLSTITSSQSMDNNYEVVYAWNQIDYNFPNLSVRSELLLSGGFIPINCIPTGLKIYENRVFLATPRYRPGVPSTLNTVPYRNFLELHQLFQTNSPKLTPFPSWEMQEIGNCEALQMVQAMELDPYDRLWVVDVGRTAVLTPFPQNLCPAKLVIYDLTSNKLDRVYQFPNQVVPNDTNAIKDIQIACTSRDNCLSYIANINYPYKVIMYDYKTNDSWYATHSSMEPETTNAVITINGVTTLAPFGLTGLGLTPKSTNYSTLYYSKIAGAHIYSVATSYLKDYTTLKDNPTLPDSVIQDLGEKPMGQADGTAMDNRGYWYFGSLPESTVYSIKTNGTPGEIPEIDRHVHSVMDMQWPDTFSFDGNGNLLFTTARFQLFTNNLINPLEVNYRLIRFRTDSVAYSAF